MTMLRFVLSTLAQAGRAALRLWRAAPGGRFFTLSPILPFYILGQAASRQLVWPLIFLPFIVAANFVWVLVVVSVAIVAMAEAEYVGQSLIIRYALWATLASLMVNVGHDLALNWLNKQVDFLLEAHPWRLIGLTYVAVCAAIFVYNTLLAALYLRLRASRAVLLGYTVALLSAPWSTLAVLDVGQGRLPGVALRSLALAIAGLLLGPWLVVSAIVPLRRMASPARFVVALGLAIVGSLAASYGANAWNGALFATGAGPLGASGLGGEIAFATRGRIYAMLAGGGGNRSVSGSPGAAIAWSPDGKLLLTSQGSTGEAPALALLPAREAGKLIVLGSGDARSDAWAPDSSAVVYVSKESGAETIQVVSKDGQSRRAVAAGRSPSWSSDGKRIVYSARWQGRSQIWVVNPDGSDPIQLTTDGGEDPAWSPDGRYIAYSYNNRVHVMEATGAGRRRLAVEITYLDTRPLLMWSGDGRRLAYAYVYPPESGRPTQLYIWDSGAPAATGTPRPVATPTPGLSLPALDVQPALRHPGDMRPPFAWSPDGLWLGFVRQGAIWALNTATSDEQRLGPGDSFAWGSAVSARVTRAAAPTYAPTRTPTPLPASVVEMPAVLLLDPKDNTTIYAGVMSGVLKKTDSRGWFLSNTGVVYPTKVRAMSFEPGSATVLYMGTDGDRTVPGALYKSADAGAQWVQTALRDADIYQLSFDPRQPGTLFLGTSKGFYASEDGGKTFIARNSGLRSQTAQALAVGSAASTAGGRAVPFTLYLGTRQSELYTSSDAGATWRFLQNLGAPITALVVHPQKPQVIFATTEEGLFRSVDGGETWIQVTGGLLKVRLDGLLVDPKDGNNVYAFGYQGVYASHDGGTNWGPITAGLEGAQPSALVINPRDPAILYAGTVRGLYKTANGGQSWAP